MATLVDLHGRGYHQPTTRLAPCLGPLRPCSCPEPLVAKEHELLCLAATPTGVAAQPVIPFGRAKFEYMDRQVPLPTPCTTTSDVDFVKYPFGCAEFDYTKPPSTTTIADAKTGPTSTPMTVETAKFHYRRHVRLHHGHT